MAITDDSWLDGWGSTITFGGVRRIFATAGTVIVITIASMNSTWIGNDIPMPRKAWYAPPWLDDPAPEFPRPVTSLPVRFSRREAPRMTRTTARLAGKHGMPRRVAKV